MGEPQADGGGKRGAQRPEGEEFKCTQASENNGYVGSEETS